MIISLFNRMIIYDIILVFSLIIAGYTVGIKIYALSFMFIMVAFLAHARLTRMLELGEEGY